MTSPSFVNVSTLAYSGYATDLTLNLPASRVNGNLLIGIITTQGSPTLTWPGGWTPIDSSPTDGNTSYAYCYVTGSETAPDVTWSGGQNANGIIVQYTGVAASSPIGAKNQNQDFSYGAISVTDAGITTTAADSTVALIVSTLYNPVPATISGYTQEASVTSAAPPIALYDVAMSTLGSTSTAVSASIGSFAGYQFYGFEILGEAGGETDLAATNDSLGVRMAVTLEDERQLSAAAPGLGVRMAAALERERQLTDHPVLGVRMAVTLERERQLTDHPVLGVRMAVTLEDERQLSAAAGLGVRLAAALERERQLSAAPGLGVRMAASLTDYRDFSAAAGLGVRMAAALYRESDLSDHPVLGVRMAATLTRELNLTVAPHFGLTVTAVTGSIQALTLGPTLGVLMAVALDLERQLADHPALGVRMAASLTDYRDLSAAAGLGVRMVALLNLADDIGGPTPDAHTVHALIGVRMAAALERERCLSNAPSLGMLMAVALSLSGELHITASMVLGVRTAASMHDVSSASRQPVVVVIT